MLTLNEIVNTLQMEKALDAPRSTGMLCVGTYRPRVSEEALERARQAWPDATEDELYEAAADEQESLRTDYDRKRAARVP